MVVVDVVVVVGRGRVVVVVVGRGRVVVVVVAGRVVVVGATAGWGVVVGGVDRAGRSFGAPAAMVTHHMSAGFTVVVVVELVVLERIDVVGGGRGSLRCT